MRRMIPWTVILALLLVLASCGSVEITEPDGETDTPQSVAEQDPISESGEEEPADTVVQEVRTDYFSGGEAVAAQEGYLYYVAVNTEANVVTVYGADEEGLYTVPVRAMICSTGEDTPRDSSFSLYGKNLWYWLGLVHGVYGRYATQIEGDILFHSVPYAELGENGSLLYEEYDKLGTAASAGCVRLQMIDAIWIFENQEDIQGVRFYASPYPGPLGKPELEKIGDNRMCRDWDPTDPDSDNPWLTRPATVRVGNYVGLGEMAACDAVISDGLIIGDILYVYSDMAAGTVTSQSAETGRQVERDAAIILTVSQGPESD